MNTWYYLWMTVFVVSTVAFGLIAIVVVIRGVGDLKTMLRGLRIARNVADSTHE